MCTVSETIIIKGRASFAKVEKAKCLLANGSAGISQVRSVMRYSYEKWKKEIYLVKSIAHDWGKKKEEKTHLYSKFFQWQYRKYSEGKTRI